MDFVTFFLRDSEYQNKLLIKKTFYSFHFTIGGILIAKNLKNV